jgi:hypothetical protein
LNANQDRGENESKQKQEIADLSDGTLRVRNGARRSDELRGAAKESIAASGCHHPAHRALLCDASGIGLIADFLGNG